MKILYKSQYKQRFFGQYFVRSIVQIIDGIITIFTGWFGYECDLYGRYCEYSLRKDFERAKKERGW